MHRRGSSRSCAVYTYKYWIQPVVIPREVWETGRHMQAVWNQLVALREAASERVKAVEAVPGELEKAAIHAELEIELRDAVNRSGLNWECREFILDKFKLATLRAITRIKTGAPARMAGFPRLRTQLQKITIPHRYTGGGVPPFKLIRPRPWKSTKRFWMGSVPREAYLDNVREHRRLRYAEGFFGLDGGMMRFKAMVHRAIPDEARVKNVVLIGTQSREFGWEWAISVVCEVPACPISAKGTGRYCGLDLGWRKFDGYLRIGMLVDNAGKVIELRLPLEMSNRRTRDFNTWIAKADRPAADRIYESWEELRAAISRADQSMESLKAKLTRLAEPIDLPDTIRSLLTQLQALRKGGLIRLLLALQEAQVAIVLQDLILAWKKTDDKARRRIQSARLRLIRRRQSHYHNLAAWITSNYDIISWEAGLGIKAMADEPG
ncbi:MAG: hypothetical protein HY650_03580 [Acidobacteria bacterium]|nr:hypothetical protein [Acidobacteriota bacterium]